MTTTDPAQPGDAAKLPLAGIRVLDVSHIIAGPMCGVVLADFGADVIKVEPPGKGERGRAVAPYITAGDAKVSSFFATINRNRRGVTLDLKTQAGKEAFLKLAATSDVLLENFAPGTMKELGLGYDDLRSLNPRLVYVAISGFGQLEPHAGPWSERPANNATSQAMSGLMELSGDADGPPAFIGGAIGDTVPGLWAVIGTLMALEQRRHTGEGQFVDVAMYDSLAAMCFNAISNYHATGISQARGSASWQETFTGRMKCADGHVAVSLWGTLPERWSKLWSLIGREDMQSHPEFDPRRPGRPRCAQIAKEALDPWLARTTRQDAVNLLVGLGFSAGPVQTIAEVYDCPQLAARHAFIQVDDGLGGSIRTLGVPVKFSAMAFPVPRRAPRLGEHNDEILPELAGKDIPRAAGRDQEAT